MRNLIDIVAKPGTTLRRHLVEEAQYWTAERVEKLTGDFAAQTFSSPALARLALLQSWRSMRRPDEPGMFTDFENTVLKKWADAAPTFSGKSGIHLGIKEHRCPWTDMEIRREDGRYIHDTAQAQSEYDYDVIPIRNYDLDMLLGPASEDRYMMGAEGQRCRRLAAQIEEHGWFTAIIVDVSNPKEPYIVEGQHRARAARLLGFKTVPAHGLDFGEDDEAINESILMESSRTLYHGTLTKFIPSIVAHDLWPTVGAFTKDAYRESEDAGIVLPSLVFAADKSGIKACGSAILDALKRAGYPRTIRAFASYGAIAVLRNREKDFAHRDADDEGYEDHPEQVEPGDYYTDGYVKVDRVITGKPLIRFMMRYHPEFVGWFGFGADRMRVVEPRYVAVSEAVEGNDMVFYHVTPKENVRSIMRRGLIPKIGDRSAKMEMKPGIYLFQTLDDCMDGMNWLADEFDEDEELVVLEVTLPTGTPIQKQAFEVVCRQPIPPSWIRATEVEV